MHFHGPIVRPLTDAYSLFIELTVGCTHNSCTFCNFYDGYPFRVAPLEQIEADLREARARFPHVEKIWASGGNPYALSTEKLEAIGQLFQKYFPTAEISMYARVDDLMRKSVEDMRKLKTLGFSNILVGVETGDDETLKHVNKGYTAVEILEGCQRLEAAGVKYRVIYLGAIAGKGKTVQAAKNTVAIFNQLHPYLMYLTTVSVLPGTKLYEERKQGKFIEPNEKERLEEFITLLSGLKNDMYVYAAPNTTRFSFMIDLQKEKGEVIDRMREIQQQLTEEDEERMQAYRDAMVSV